MARVLDPCAGQGEALADLTVRLDKGIHTYGIELSPQPGAAQRPGARPHQGGRAAGGRQSVPPPFRHTCATQLLNAGCRVTSIQRFLGHKRLNTTMVYAKVHDHQVAEDYYAAMQQIEKHLDLAQTEQVKVLLEEAQRGQLLALTDQLAAPELRRSERLELVAQLRWLLEPQSVIE